LEEGDRLFNGRFFIIRVTAIDREGTTKRANDCKARIVKDIGKN